MKQYVSTKQGSIELKIGPKWRTVDTGLAAAAIGYAFSGDKYLDAEGLATLFSQEVNLDFKRFAALLKKLNGNFAVIVKSEDAVFASVDKIRSCPLFYSMKDTVFLISDNARSISDDLRAKSLDEDAVNEFLMSGYISGDRTLLSQIKQLRAGEGVCFSAGDNGRQGNTITERYYTYYDKDKMRLCIDEMISAYDKVLRETFRRLINSMQGRKIIIPLSGGIDSRLIACMLKELDYKNVLCFSYGVPDNWETGISKKVAERLGSDWIYMPYSRSKWRSAYRSKEFKDFFYSADNLSSIPNVGDWIAVKEMKEKRLIPDDAVFVPGHTGDFISGGHLQYAFNKEGNVTQKDLLNSILNKHYGLWKKDLEKPQIKEQIMDRLDEFIKSLPADSKEDLADTYECWEWQERQAKFIVNAVRNYDYWGYDWRLPFWDSEYISFWSKVPFEMKLHKRLYLTYLQNKNKFGLFGDDIQRKELYRKGRFKSLKKFIEYFRDINGMYGIYGYFTISFLNMGRRDINSILVKDYTRSLRKNMPA